MLLLVTKSLPDVERRRHPHLGRLLQPRHYPRAVDTTAAGIPWAADNDAYLGWSPARAAKYITMLDALKGSAPMWITVPDVVGDWAETARLFDVWAPAVERRGLPVALVAQDGLIPERVPWHRISGLFVGGTDAWKMSAAAERLTIEAKERGKLVHVGRVNGARRVRDLKAWGTVDSVDGTSFARFFDTWIGDGLAWVSAAPQQRLAVGGEER